jgi:hypothetical protein
VAVGAKVTSEFIGKPYHKAADANGGNAPLLNDAYQIAGHTIVGCAMGEAISGDCTAGAAGAVVGEVGAE